MSRKTGLTGGLFLFKNTLLLYYTLSRMKLWLKGAKQIVQVVDKGQAFLTGEAMKRLAVLEANEDDNEGGGLSIIVDGYIIKTILHCVYLSKNSRAFSLHSRACKNY